jgi:hypothetical protein
MGCVGYPDAHSVLKCRWLLSNRPAHSRRAALSGRWGRGVDAAEALAGPFEAVLRTVARGVYPHVFLMPSAAAMSAKAAIPACEGGPAVLGGRSGAAVPATGVAAAGLYPRPTAAPASCSARRSCAVARSC